MTVAEQDRALLEARTRQLTRESYEEDVRSSTKLLERLERWPQAVVEYRRLFEEEEAIAEANEAEPNEPDDDDSAVNVNVNANANVDAVVDVDADVNVDESESESDSASDSASDSDAPQSELDIDDLNAGRLGRCALELRVKGWSSMPKGRSARRSRANCPGAKRSPRWPSAASSRVTASPRSRRIPRTR